jgi:glucose/arabinose dehydrogenase
MGATRVMLVAGVAATVGLSAAALAQNPPASRFGDWRTDVAGKIHHIKPSDLPAPFETPSASNGTSIGRRPANAQLKVPTGFEIRQFASGLERPRILRVAPNGDIFTSESSAGRVRVLRPKADNSGVARNEVFASGLGYPFGIAFYPAGDNPEWVYVATSTTVVRFPYRNGDTVARGRPETLVTGIPGGGHVSRDIVFSPDGTRMFVSVGSESNVGDRMGRLEGAEKQKFIADHPLGTAWGNEFERAAVLAFDPQGKGRRIFATGIRNCVGMAIQPGSGDLWCSTNERDLMGDDLVPDYITSVKEGRFYGWPWYYIGGNEDPRQKGVRPDLADKVTVPEILIQPHSASMQMLFYTGSQFPAAYKGSIFAAQHGSWNRAVRTGYKVIRGIMKDGKPTGQYEDFVTGFSIDADSVWGRPVGIAQARDGSLLFSEDGNGTIWRVTSTARR